jgi:prevent-host-death family protein
MLQSIATKTTASITELKANPMGTIAAANGEPIAILNRNAPAFYCVPTETFEQMMELLEDAQLAQLVREREGEAEVTVSLDEL